MGLGARRGDGLGVGVAAAELPPPWRPLLSALLVLLALALGPGARAQQATFERRTTNITGGRVKGAVKPIECTEPEWSYRTMNFIQGSATVRRDTGVVYVGSNVGALFAFTAAGELLWRFETKSYVRSTPTVGPDGTVYFGSDDKHLYAVDPDGTEKWRFKTKWIISSAPALAADGTIYVGSMDRKLYALTPDGELKWKYNLLGEVAPEGIVTSSPTVGDDGTIYIGSMDEQLYALTPDGKKAWSFQTEGEVRSTPAIGKDGAVYFGSVDGHLYAVNGDGSLKWKVDMEEPIYGSPTVGPEGMRERVFVGVGDGTIRAVDSGTGEESWRYDTGEEINGGAIVHGDTLYIGSGDMNVYAIFTNGDLRWKFPTKSYVSGTPAVAKDGTVYIGSFDQNFYAIGCSRPVKPKSTKLMQTEMDLKQRKLADEMLVLLAAKGKKDTQRKATGASQKEAPVPKATSAKPTAESSPDKSHSTVKPNAKSQKSAKSLNDAHRYCIIGAGPGGLQLGQFFRKAGRDYVTFEKKLTPGSFYESFPIHRRLTSINKRFTGRSDPMFNMRHDWNSLLETSVLPVTGRTEDRFPHADVLVDYLRDFAAEQEADGRIMYGTEVTNIARNADGQSFTVKVTSHRDDRVDSTTICGCVVIAQGLLSPNIPDGWDEVQSDGRKLTQGYEELMSHGRYYENRSVAVFGMGNAAFEAADAIAPYAQYVHVFHGHKKQQTPLAAWESRYEGDLRAVNAQLLDTYVLKSLDGGFATNGPNGRTSVVLPCGEERRKRCIILTHDAVDEATGEPTRVIHLPAFDTNEEQDVAFVRSLGVPIKIKSPVYVGKSRVDYPDLPICSDELHGKVCTQHKVTEVPSFRMNNSLGAVVYMPLAAINDKNIDDFVAFSKRQGGQYPLVYDDVIRCLGWSQNLEVFAADAQPLMQTNQKFAVMTNEYESVNVPGMYFAGELSHGKDYKRSAGGFIHGFRYTARALFRTLSAKYEDEPWPTEQFDLQVDVQVGRLADKVFYRVNHADGNYQMVHSLGDGIVLRCKHGHGIVAEYIEEIPISQFNDKYADSPRFIWTFGYGQQSRSLAENMASGTVFELFVWYFGAGTAAEQHTATVGEGPMRYHPKELFSMRESLHMSWESVGNRKNLMGFLLSRVNTQQTGGFCVAAEPGHMLGQLAKRASSTAELESHLDLTVPAQVADKGASPWYPGQVDLWILNTLEGSLQLTCDRSGKNGCTEVDEIRPGDGVHVIAYDTDIITAIVAGGSHEVEKFRVDVSNGIVQDWAIGLPRRIASSHRIAPLSAKTDASTYSPSPEQQKWKRGDPKPGAPKKQEAQNEKKEKKPGWGFNTGGEQGISVTKRAVEPEPVVQQDNRPVVKCGPGEVRIARDLCESKSSQSIAQTSSSALKAPHHVPIFLKNPGSRLKKIMPWLKNYILEREEEWKQLPRGQGAFDESDPTVSARSTAYNLLSSGRTVIEKAKLKILRDAIGAAVIEYMQKWTAPGVSLAPLAEATPYRAGVNSMKWDDIPSAWVECWCNIHRAAPGHISPDSWCGCPSRTDAICTLFAWQPDDRSVSYLVLICLLPYRVGLRAGCAFAGRNTRTCGRTATRTPSRATCPYRRSLRRPCSGHRGKTKSSSRSRRRMGASISSRVASATPRKHQLEAARGDVSWPR